jgi:RND superfamily putative drug exporter
MEALLARVAYVARRRRWWFVAFWVVALVALGSFAGRAQEELSSGGFEVPGSESQRVIDFFEAQADEGAQPFTFLVDAPDAASAEARLREVVATAVRIEPRLHVEEESVPSADGTTVAAFGAAAVSQDDGLKLAERLKDEVQRTEGAERTFVLGASATYETMQRTVTSDLARAETLTLPVVAIVLVGLFGALVAASLPLLLTLVSVVVTTGLVYFVATQTEVSVFATTMISMIGIGVAVDYTMFVLARYREELAAGVSSEAAVVTALRSSGTAVVFSGLTVIVSLLSIWAVPVRAVQSMAGGAVLVVAVAVLAAATLLPALLHIAGRRVDRGRIRLRRRRAAVRPVGPSTFWTAWVARIMRRPLPGSSAAPRSSSC